MSSITGFVQYCIMAFFHHCVDDSTPIVAAKVQIPDLDVQQLRAILEQLEVHWDADAPIYACQARDSKAGKDIIDFFVSSPKDRNFELRITVHEKEMQIETSDSREPSDPED